MSRIIHPNFIKSQSNQTQDAENRPQEKQDTRQPEAPAKGYMEARSQMEDILNEAACLSELIDGPIVGNELHLSISATMGLGSILRGFNERGWQTLELLDEAWSARSGGNE